MKDLTGAILEASNIKNNLTQEEYLDKLELFAKGNKLIFCFEDGEEWVTLSSLDIEDILGRVHYSMPLAFIDFSIYNKIELFFDNHKLDFCLEKVESWDEEIYSVDKSKIENILPWNSSLPCDSFSANRLWYATV